MGQGVIVAMEDPKRRLFGLQYHPEVVHSDKGGATLRHFLMGICGLKPNWSMQNVLENKLRQIDVQVGACHKCFVLCLLLHVED